jgi:hypothetical protein
MFSTTPGHSLRTFSLGPTNSIRLWYLEKRHSDNHLQLTDLQPTPWKVQNQTTHPLYQWLASSDAFPIILFPNGGYDIFQADSSHLCSNNQQTQPHSLTTSNPSETYPSGIILT